MKSMKSIEEGMSRRNIVCVRPEFFFFKYFERIRTNGFPIGRLMSINLSPIVKEKEKQYSYNMLLLILLLQTYWFISIIEAE